MPLVTIAPRGERLAVGKCPPGSWDEASAAAFKGHPTGVQPTHMRVSGDTAVATLGPGSDTSVRWRGHTEDIREGLHWILTPVEDGSYTLRPVDSWFTFSLPRRDANVPRAAGGQDEEEEDELERAEREMHAEAKLRAQHELRWQRCLQRRSERTSRFFTKQEVRDSVKGPGLPVAKIKEKKESYLEEERLQDATGLQRAAKKRKKALKSKAKALDEAEEDDVPETANALFHLKSQRGDGAWDFEDHEAHSDDDEEVEGFDDQLQPDLGEEAVMAEAEEDAEDEKEDKLAAAEREIQRLQAQCDAEGDPGGQTEDAPAAPQGAAARPRGQQPPAGAGRKRALPR